METWRKQAEYSEFVVDTENVEENKEETQRKHSGKTGNMEKNTEE